MPYSELLLSLKDKSNVINNSVLMDTLCVNQHIHEENIVFKFQMFHKFK